MYKLVRLDRKGFWLDGKRYNRNDLTIGAKLAEVLACEDYVFVSEIYSDFDLRMIACAINAHINKEPKIYINHYPEVLK